MGLGIRAFLNKKNLEYDFIKKIKNFKLFFGEDLDN
jgi:hypothetical protein